MAKKSRKTRAKQGVKGISGQGLAAKQVQPIISRAGQAASHQPSADASAVGTNHYDYVVSDLIRIGIIAGGLLIVLIILTFILR